MWNVDPYLQTQWQLTDKLSLDAGVRYSSVWFDSNDYYITPGNGDDSGDASYHKWLPAGSLKYAVTDAWNVYSPPAAAFETPTINELFTAPITRAAELSACSLHQRHGGDWQQDADRQWPVYRRAVPDQHR
jgi:outer membrane receptor protein involved in Fe transport